MMMEKWVSTDLPALTDFRLTDLQQESVEC
jgi:hypothetical protein